MFDHFVGLALKKLKDIYDLAKLCLSKCYFLWKNEIRTFKKLGTVGLSFMVVLSESYIQNWKTKPMQKHQP